MAVARKHNGLPKLIRWKIAPDMCLGGERPVTEWVAGGRLFGHLLDKLVEEANELQTANTVEKVIEESGDVEQVVRDILKERDIAWGWLNFPVDTSGTATATDIVEQANFLQRAEPHNYKRILEDILVSLNLLHASSDIDSRDAERVRLVKFNKKGGFVQERMGLLLLKVLRSDLLETA